MGKTSSSLITIVKFNSGIEKCWKQILIGSKKNDGTN
jgi:hypothetical protein